MTRIEPLTTENASSESSALLTKVKEKIGMVPNLYGAIAHSPAALGAYLSFAEAIGQSSISASLREQIALTTAGINKCNYCASAHTLIGGSVGIQGDELARNLKGESDDQKVQAALSFTNAIVNKRGFVDNADLAAVRGAGYSEAEISEIIAVVSINIFTNYFNHISEVDVDFPLVSAQ